MRAIGTGVVQFSFRMFDHNFLDLVQIEGEMQRDEIQKVTRFLLL